MTNRMNQRGAAMMGERFNSLSPDAVAGFRLPSGAIVQGRHLPRAQAHELAYATCCSLAVEFDQPGQDVWAVVTRPEHVRQLRAAQDRQKPVENNQLNWLDVPDSLAG